MLPVLDGLSARNWARDSEVITAEIFIISMAIIAAADAKNLSTTVQHDTTVTINGTVVTGSPMTNQDATGLTYYNVFAGVTTDAKLTEQMDAVIAYFEKYSYAITRTSATGNSVTWNISW
jgi:hypothetical protein